MSAWEDVAEQRIRAAVARGDFDDLPGAGRPIEWGDDPDDPDWWIHRTLAREGVALPLPPSLVLKKERAEVTTTLATMTPAERREYVDDLNRRIRLSRARPLEGPPVVIREVGDDEAGLAT